MSEPFDDKRHRRNEPHFLSDDYFNRNDRLQIGPSPISEIFGMKRQVQKLGPLEDLLKLELLIHELKIKLMKKGTESYLIFDDVESRKVAVEIGKNIASYMHDRGLQDIVFVDRAARPAYISLKENWRHMYPNDPIPNIYFMNPKGFKSKDKPSMNSESLLFEFLGSFIKGEEVENPSLMRTEKEIAEEARKIYKKLLDKPNKHILLYDNCIHSGKSVKPIIDTLTGMGLDVRLGISSDNRNSSGINADLVCLDTVPKGSCYPFDKDQLVSKTYSSVTSKPSIGEDRIIFSRQIRKEIKKAVTEYYITNRK